MNRRARITFALAVPALLIGVEVAGRTGMVINDTPSMAEGVYWKLHRAPQIGEVVALCPPDREPFRTARDRGYMATGPCPGGYVPLIKRFLAKAGDRVHIGPDGVAINGNRLPGSAPRAADGLGRPLPRVRLDRELAAHEVLVMTDYPDSFDGRYTGPLDRTVIQSAMRPVATW